MNEPLTLSILFGMSLFLVLLSCFILRYESESRRKRNTDQTDWLLADFSYKVYGALFGNQPPEKTALKLKIDVTGYVSDCRIAGQPADLRKIVSHTVYGIVLFFIGCVLGLIANSMFSFLGVFFLCWFCVIEKKQVHRRAQEKRHQIEMELPRFLDLLRTELNVGLPVETAIYVICERTDTLLSKEFFLALHKMEFGAAEWGSAMESIAAKYNVDSLSNFVLNIVTAYRKGVSVANAVEREYQDIHKEYLLNIRDRAEKTKSAALLPMFFLQLFPLIAFIAFPLFLTLMQYM